MRTLLKSITLLFVISWILTACNPVEPVEAINPIYHVVEPGRQYGGYHSLADGNNSFGLDLLHQLGPDPTTFFIPTSASLLRWP